jgi:polysaccharide biosynthesis protein PelF
LSHRRSGAFPRLVLAKDPKGLAAALLVSASDPARREAMGERARTRVLAEFSLERSVETYEAVYASLMT